jgi:twitching motility protein PilT
MTEKKASDLHIASEYAPMIRESGDMHPITGVPKLSREQIHQILMEIAPEHIQQEFEQHHDTDFAYTLEGCGRFRTNYFTDRNGPGAVFRRIPDSIVTAEQLGLPTGVMRLTEFNKGLVLVTGPAGTGKSTTLAAMIDTINATRREHIITIEDPIEFVHQPKNCMINQREVHTHTDSFAAAMRAALREDPNTVMVGELRDLETTRIAIETAETGHLVFATIHTSSAAQTVDRIINQFPSQEQEQIRQMLSNGLRGVVTQTLLRRRGGGRVAAHEILLVTPAVSALIREGKTFQIPSQIQTGGKYGMQLMNDAIERLVRSGQIEALEAYERAVDKEDMSKRLKPLGHDVETLQFQVTRAKEAAKRAEELAALAGQPDVIAPPAGSSATSIYRRNQDPPGAAPPGTASWKRPPG